MHWFQKCLQLHCIKMKCIQYTQVLEYVDCADWILFLDEEERRAAEVLSSRGKQKFITDRNILEKINLMIADKYFKELKDAGVLVLNITFPESKYLEQLYLNNENLEGIPCINMKDILEEQSVNVSWMVDHPAHCNHKINSLYANAIYRELVPALPETTAGRSKLSGQLEDFVKRLYLDRYFADFDVSLYQKIGAIVMNCNPFTYGHCHLIESALKKVDFLILFVVEEDRSIFPFAERFAMVCHGIEDLDNVMAVPSGPFILSEMTFPEYFIKIKDEEIVQNVENDIIFFAEKIAPHLRIQCRFVGEEPEDIVTNEYNLAMKRILPGYGIELVEIPRKVCKGAYISASSVRKCLEENAMEQLKRLVPETTRRILGLEEIPRKESDGETISFSI